MTQGTPCPFGTLPLPSPWSKHSHSREAPELSTDTWGETGCAHMWGMVRAPQNPNKEVSDTHGLLLAGWSCLAPSQPVTFCTWDNPGLTETWLTSVEEKQTCQDSYQLNQFNGKLKIALSKVNVETQTGFRTTPALSWLKAGPASHSTACDTSIGRHVPLDSRISPLPLSLLYQQLIVVTGEQARKKARSTGGAFLTANTFTCWTIFLILIILTF